MRDEIEPTQGEIEMNIKTTSKQTSQLGGRQGTRWGAGVVGARLEVGARLGAGGQIGSSRARAGDQMGAEGQIGRARRQRGPDWGNLNS